MNVPIRDTRTNDAQMFFYWSPTYDTDDIGGSAILSYGLQWDDGTDGA
jgi:hypothetical protein